MLNGMSMMPFRISVLRVSKWKNTKREETADIVICSSLQYTCLYLIIHFRSLPKILRDLCFYKYGGERAGGWVLNVFVICKR